MDSMRLRNFPISFFAPALGLAGMALAVLKSEELFHLPRGLTVVLIGLSIAVFAAVGVVYLIKLILHRESVREEYLHPVRMNFFPLIAKVLLVLSIVFLGLSPVTSRWLWGAGLILNLVFGISILSAWISHEHFKIQHLSPAWFIPVVGNIMVPIAGVQHATPELSWFFFAVGLSWMVILTVIILNRLIFHDPLPEKLIPTLFILFAAPAIAFISYYKLTESFDAFARILYYFALFVFVLVFAQWRRLLKIRFYLSWWAYSFPLAAFTLATVLMFHVTGLPFFRVLAGVVLAVLVALVSVLIVLTVRAISRGEICVEET